MKLLYHCMRIEVYFLFHWALRMSDASFVFAVSEVKEDTVSLVLGCVAAAPACTASVPADHSCAGGKFLFLLEQLLLK